LGLLWQTNSINPAHEHFITNLIKQKVLINTEALIAQTPDNKEPGFVLFLPDNEIHDLGIAFLNYEILLRGYRTVYLGESVPLDSLETFTSNSEKLIFVSYFTVAPATEDVLSYLQDFKDKILDHCASELWILGCMTKGLEKKDVPKNIKIFAQIDEVLKMFP
jgi:methanogenic corrinoid protein MtbC1